jgi:hypothetical protein
MNTFLVYLGLNVLDILLTLEGIHRGFSEGNSLAIWLMRIFGIISGLLLLKAVALIYGFVLLYFNQIRQLRLCNILYTCIAIIPWILVLMGVIK